MGTWGKKRLKYRYILYRDILFLSLPGFPLRSVSSPYGNGETAVPQLIYDIYPPAEFQCQAEAHRLSLFSGG